MKVDLVNLIWCVFVLFGCCTTTIKQVNAVGMLRFGTRFDDTINSRQNAISPDIEDLTIESLNGGNVDNDDDDDDDDDTATAMMFDNLQPAALPLFSFNNNINNNRRPFTRQHTSFFGNIRTKRATQENRYLPRQVWNVYRKFDWRRRQ